MSLRSKLRLTRRRSAKPSREPRRLPSPEGSSTERAFRLCTEKAMLQAEEFGHSPEREIIYLFTHSLLHLMGYDHMEEDEKRIMRQKEEAVMNRIDLGR